MNKENILARTIEFILGVVGFSLIILRADWQLAAGIMLIVISMSIGKEDKKWEK